MAKYLTSKEMEKLLVDHLYGLVSMTDIASLHHCSVGNIHHKLRALVHGLGFHHATRDPYIISAALFRRDLRNRTWDNTPEALYRFERNLSEKENWR